MTLAIDLGTTSVKGGLFSPTGRCVATASAPLPLKRHDNPLVGEVEAGDWLACAKVILGILLPGRNKLDCLVVSGNGPTLLPADREGKALHAALTWMDRRATQEALDAGLAAGERIDSSFYLPKALWFARHRPDIYERTASFYACPEYLIRLLTGASVTVFPGKGYEALYWKPEWLEDLGLDPGLFPPFVETGSIVGATREDALGLPAGIPVVAGGPDFLAALVGTATTTPGRACDRAGTSEGINLCSALGLADRRLLTMPHVIRPLHNISGAVSTSGKSLEWWKESSGAAELPWEEFLAAAEATPAGSGGLLFLPYLAGERAPLWDSDARGAFIGITLAQGRPQMTRAVVEATALAMRDIITVMEEAGAEVKELRATGKPAASAFWNQVKADVTGKPLVVPKFGEAELLGGACMAFTALGRYATLAEAAEDLVVPGRRFDPDPATREVYDRLFAIYRESYAALKPLFPRLGKLCEGGSP